MVIFSAAKVRGKVDGSLHNSSNLCAPIFQGRNFKIFRWRGRGKIQPWSQLTLMESTVTTVIICRCAICCALLAAICPCLGGCGRKIFRPYNMAARIL